MSYLHTAQRRDSFRLRYVIGENIPRTAVLTERRKLDRLIGELEMRRADISSITVA